MIVIYGVSMHEEVENLWCSISDPIESCLMPKTNEIMYILITLFEVCIYIYCRLLCIRSLENICMYSFDSASSLILRPLIDTLNADSISTIKSSSLELLLGVSQNCSSKVCTTLLPPVLQCCQKFFQGKLSGMIVNEGLIS